MMTSWANVTALVFATGFFVEAVLVIRMSALVRRSFRRTEELVAHTKIWEDVVHQWKLTAASWQEVAERNEATAAIWQNVAVRNEAIARDLADREARARKLMATSQKTAFWTDPL